MFRKFAVAAAAVCLMAVSASAQSARTEPFILGADISWVQQREAEGWQYRQQGENQNKDMLEILKQNKFNYIRLRLFVDPTASSRNDPGPDDWGWSASPYSASGYCGLDSTVKYAKRVKDAGFKFLLDFHYSDTWADPARQWKPESWHGLNFNQLTDKIRTYTKESLEKFKDAGALPDMVQVGNEVVHGMIHNDGSLSNWKNFAALVNAGINGVKDADQNILIMMHTITRNDNGPADAWVTNLRTNLNSVETNAANKVDVIGLSYYPKWHGNLDTLSNVVNRIAGQTAHNYKISVVEYADYHREVNDIVFALPENRRFGTFVWEPQEFDGDDSKPLFDGNWQNRRRTTNGLMNLYPQMSSGYGNDDIDDDPPSAADIRGYGSGKNIRGASVTVKGRTLSVSSPNNLKLGIRMIDTRGKVRARFTAMSGNANFALAKIPAGRYLVEVQGAGIKQTLPVIVK